MPSSADNARVVYRRAVPTDAPAIGSLHADSWRRNYRGIFTDEYLDRDVSAERQVLWSDRLTGDPSGEYTIVASCAGDVVGFAHIMFGEDPTWGALLDNLHVTDQLRGGGIGTGLLRETAQAVISSVSEGLYLWVFEQNTSARAFYRARGGRYQGSEPAPPPGGVGERLVGAPVVLRVVWPDPARLLR